MPLNSLNYVLTRRDGLLILIGACVVYFSTSFFHYYGNVFNLSASTSPLVSHPKRPTNYSVVDTDPGTIDLGFADIVETNVIAHAPGWTLFENLYMASGTLYAVTSDPGRFPKIRMMTSTGVIAINTPENIRQREPTDREMQLISPEVAASKWGGNIAKKERNRIWSIEGISLVVNEPGQFLNHYYHFVVELFLGAWAFLCGAFNPSFDAPDGFRMANPHHASMPSFNIPPQNLQPPQLSRVIFFNARHSEWKDAPGFNAFFFHAAFPSLDIEDAEDWHDRCVATFSNPKSQRPEKAWHLPIALLADRSAAHRGEACGSRTQRIAAEAYEYMVKKKGIDTFGRWWSHIRYKVYRFAGAEKITSDIQATPVVSAADNVTDPQGLLPPPPNRVVITYINRQSVRRRLIASHNEALVASMKDLVKKKQAEGKNWIFRNVKPERLSKEDQVQVASESTILLGVHGNGLSHLVWMEPNRYSSVIEIFYPGGFAHDYEWTTRALGMRHYSVWNDTYFTYPREPDIEYPEGFQGSRIPVHGPTVAKLIEDRLEGRLQY